VWSRVVCRGQVASCSTACRGGTTVGIRSGPGSRAGRVGVRGARGASWAGLECRAQVPEPGSSRMRAAKPRSTRSARQAQPGPHADGEARVVRWQVRDSAPCPDMGFTPYWWERERSDPKLRRSQCGAPGQVVTRCPASVRGVRRCLRDGGPAHGATGTARHDAGGTRRGNRTRPGRHQPDRARVGEPHRADAASHRRCPRCRPSARRAASFLTPLRHPVAPRVSG
jgi:hypothetical protein